MPRYYLNVWNDEKTLDEEGIECSGIPAVKAQAVNAIRDILAEEVRKGVFPGNLLIEVCDGEGNLVLTVTGSEAVEFRK